MNDWILATRIMPAGGDFGPAFSTIDGFADWEQIARNGEGLWAAAESAHPDKDLDEVMNKISALRTRPRAEIWELVVSTTPPTKDKPVVKVVAAGTGPHPMRGQQVAYDIEVSGADGKVIFDNRQMVGIPLQMVLGSAPYDSFSSKWFSQIGTGGKLSVKMPLSIQPQSMRDQNGNQDVTVKFHLLEVGPPATDGSATLREMMLAGNLSAARKWHNNVKSGEEYVFQEWTMNALGYDLMEKGHTNGALYVMAENQRANPQSANAHDSLADAYRAAGNHVMAAKHYEQSVKMNPNATASKEKLAELRK